MKKTLATILVGGVVGGAILFNGTDTLVEVPAYTDVGIGQNYVAIFKSNTDGSLFYQPLTMSEYEHCCGHSAKSSDMPKKEGYTWVQSVGSVDTEMKIKQKTVLKDGEYLIERPATATATPIYRIKESNGAELLVNDLNQ